MSTSTATLNAKVASGSAWAFASQAFRLFTAFGSTAILARMLPPADFGLFGVLTSGLVFLYLFQDLGLTTAIIQAPNLSPTTLPGLFTLALLLGVSTAAIALLASIFAAEAVGDARASSISAIYSLFFVLNGLTLVPAALLRRNLRFKTLAIRDCICAAIGATAGIIAAFVGLGHWALIIGPLTTTALSCILTFSAADWAPKLTISGLRETFGHIRFGGQFSIGELANYVSQNVDTLLVGRWLSLEAAGFYSRATALMIAPASQILAPIGNAVIPSLSRARTTGLDYRVWYSKLCKGLMLVAAPAAACISALSAEIVQLVLGSAWESTGQVLQWLAFLLFARPAGSLIYWMLVVQGNVRTLVAWSWGNALIVVLFVMVGLSYGVVATAIALGIGSATMGVALAAYVLGRIEPALARSFVRAYLNAFLSFVVHTYVLTLLNTWLHHSGLDPVGRLAIVAGLGAASISFIIVKTGANKVINLKSTI